MKRFPFFQWDPQWIADNKLMRSDLLELRKTARDTRYPIRSVRYWWAVMAVKDEVTRLDGQAIIADVGAERGRMKLLSEDMPGVKWIGLDAHIDHPALATAKYDETYSCDFNKHLPLPDNSVDIAISLHVFEHLADPDTAMKEIARILKPGGIFLGGTPVTPKFASLIRERELRAKAIRKEQRYQERVKNGTQRDARTRPFPHLNKFWPKRWQDLCEKHGLHMDFMTGSHLLRWSGNPLENYKWWLRLNQFWGGTFPALGRELYFQARKKNNPGRTYNRRHIPVPKGPRM